MNKGLYSSERDDWETPQWLFDKLNEDFHFTLDACASDENHKCEKYYTKETDCLSHSWYGETVFCNPPYGRQIGEFVEKCYEEARNGAVVVALIPARTDTAWFHNFVYKKDGVQYVFLRGRSRFGNANTDAPFPSMLVYFHYHLWFEAKLAGKSKIFEEGKI